MPVFAYVPRVEETGFSALRAAGITDTQQAVSEGKLISLMGEDGVDIEVAGLEHGMSSGAPSVAMCFRLPDGKCVVAQTSLKLFLTVSDTLKAQFGDPR